MPRRASSSASPVWILAIIIFVVASMAGGYYLIKAAQDPYRTLAVLDVDAYLDNASSLRGNTYKLRGTIFDSLQWSPSQGRVISVDVDDSNARLGLIVPSDFNSVNIQKGQKFYFQVEVGDKGILKVKGITKA